MRCVTGFGALLALGACAVSGDPTFRSTGVGISKGGIVSIAAPETPDERDNLVEQSIRATLARDGITVADDGSIRIEYAISERPAEMALAQELRDQEVEWISAARKSSPFDGCPARRTRIVIVAYDLAASAPVYRAEGEVDACEFPAEEVVQLTNDMVSRALATE